MAAKTVVLTDVAHGLWNDWFELRPSPDLHLSGSDGWSIQKRTLKGGVSNGVDVIELHNGALAVTILPTRGMGLWRGHYRGTEIGWTSPVQQPVNPCFVHPGDHNGLGWLAGFNELLCRCGLSSNGSPGVDVIVDKAGNRSETNLTLHGKIANLPAHRVEVHASDEGKGVLSVTGVVDEAMLFGPCLRLATTYTTIAGSNRLTIRDTVTNLSGQSAELQLLYHTNLGPPFLDAGARLVVPFREMAPRDARAAEDVKTWQTYLGPTSGYAEQCYYADLIADDHEITTVLLRNAAGDRGISLDYGIRQLPSFTVWKCTQAQADGYVTGLEPAINLPNFKTFERTQKRVVQIAPGKSYRTQIELAVHTSAQEVTEVEQRIAKLQNLAHPVIHDHPIEKWSPLT